MTREQFLAAYDACRAKGLRFMSLLDLPLPEPVASTGYHGVTLYAPIATSKEDDSIEAAWKAPRPNIVIVPKKMPASQAAGYHRSVY